MPLRASAHWKPTVSSSSAAIGGPMIPAADVVASARPAARTRSSSPCTTSPIVANLAGLKNWPDAFRTNTTRYTADSHSQTGSARTGTNDTPVGHQDPADRGGRPRRAARQDLRYPQHERRAEDGVSRRGSGLAVPQLRV